MKPELVAADAGTPCGCSAVDASLNHATIDAEPDPSAHEVLQRIGAITRKLHDALSELGYDKALSNAVDRLPDARERLAYIARLTGESAEKVLTRVERAREIQDQLRSDAAKLAARLSADDGQDSRSDAVRAFVARVETAAAETNAHLTDIMMAQDFHDLTGQVVGKVVELAQTLEEQLLALLIEATPPGRSRSPGEHERLAGPAFQADRGADVVTSQSQVDDLLESLGF